MAIALMGVRERGDSWSWHLYVEGYRRAADRLVETIFEQDLDYLVYPILFLYRHYLEVGLKSLYLLYGLYLETSRTNELKKINHTHSQTYLWKLVRPRLQQAEAVDKDEDEHV